jgi:hypothetical protein
VVSYVLHDFSKKDRAWLAPLLSAIATGAPHLLAGQDAKFLNEVARVSRPAMDTTPAPRKDERTAPAAPQGTPAPTPAPAAREREAAMADAAPSRVSPPKHAAEPAETSLAAKLRAWFTRR